MYKHNPVSPGQGHMLPASGELLATPEQSTASNSTVTEEQQAVSSIWSAKHPTVLTGGDLFKVDGIELGDVALPAGLTTSPATPRKALLPSPSSIADAACKSTKCWNATPATVSDPRLDELVACHYLYKVPSPEALQNVTEDARVKIILEMQAHNLMCSLTNYNPGLDDSRRLHEYIQKNASRLAGKGKFRPLSPPTLEKLITLTVKTLKDSLIKIGVGPYKADDLRAIFRPRELLCLDACVKHWYRREEWPWRAVLIHLGLGLVMDVKMISRTANEISEKLKLYPDMLDYLELDLSDLKEDFK